MLCGLPQITCKPVVRILTELVLSQHAHNAVDLGWIQKEQQRTTNHFQRAVDTLADDTDVEEYVDQLVSLIGAQGRSPCRLTPRLSRDEITHPDEISHGCRSSRGSISHGGREYPPDLLLRIDSLHGRRRLSARL